jgi:surfeit locus 1 family protein
MTDPRRTRSPGTSVGAGGAVRALLRPRALASHALVGGVVAVLVALGQWQLARLAEVRDVNARLEARLALPVEDLQDLLGSEGRVDPADVELRRVRATGTFRPDEEVLQRNRVEAGLSGFDVLTPFDLGDGRTLLVRRGWVPRDRSEPPVADAAPPAGTVTVTGVLEPTVPQPTFGARDPAEGRLRRVFHPDTERLDRQVTGALLPLVLRLEEPVPSGPLGLPRPPAPAQLDEGSHRSYAVQWHTFAVLAVGAYSAWWWRRLRGGPR